MSDVKSSRGRGSRSRSSRSLPTVADVARLAGVSAMTVSRVMNHEPNVLEPTRAKVRAAAEALSYVPNRAARSLAGRPHCRLALLHSNPSAAYLSEVLVGCLAAAAQSDAQIVVEYCAAHEPVATLVSRLRHHRVDGVLLPPPLCDDPALRGALDAARLPFARIATGNPAGEAVSVTIDDEAAAHAITMHLARQGHARIGFIAGNPNQTASGLRRAGYERALAEAGLAGTDDLIVRGDFSYRSGLAAAETVLRLAQRPTAIFASNDDMAAAVVAVAHRLGFTVPDDLSVCGFDDSAMATTIWPELTTIRQPTEQMARAATALLERAILGDATTFPESERHARLAFELVQRGSDGPPPGHV